MKEKTFESSIRELEEIVSKLESGELDLDKSIAEYEKAVKLIDFCEEKLKNATKTINKLVKENGEISDFNVE